MMLLLLLTPMYDIAGCVYTRQIDAVDTLVVQLTELADLFHMQPF